MPETTERTQLFRFDQMAVQVKDKVEPDEVDVDRYVGLEHIDSESLKIRRWGEPSDVESSKILFKSGDIIFGKRRAYQRKLAVADFDGICSAHAMVLRPKTDVVLEEFLPFFMQSDIFMDRAVKISVGGLSPTINWRDLAKEEFALPPIEDQQRLLEPLRKADVAFNCAREAVERCRTTARSILDRLFCPYELRQHLTGIHRKPASHWVSLGDYAPLQTGFAFKSEFFSEGGDRLLRGSNVGVDCTSWDPDETRYWPEARRSEVTEYILREDDIVIAMDRPFISAGFKVAELRAADLPALLLQRVGRFQLNDDIHRQLVWAFVHSRSFQYQLLIQQEGTDLPHISKKQIEGTMLPSPSLESNLVLEAFSELSSCQRSLTERLNAVERLRSHVINEVLR